MVNLQGIVKKIMVAFDNMTEASVAELAKAIATIVQEYADYCVDEERKKLGYGAK